MTNAEIKKLVDTSFMTFIEKGFRLHKDILCIEPLNNMIVGFCFEKSGFHKDSLYVWSFVQPLYVPNEHIILTFGKRVRNEQLQIKNNKEFDKDVKELSKLMNKEIEVFLNEVSSPSKFYNYYQDKCVNLRMIEAVVYSAIYTKQKNTKTLLNNFINTIKKDDLSIKWIEDLLNQMISIKEIVDDNDKIDILLKNNIEFTKSNLKL